MTLTLYYFIFAIDYNAVVDDDDNDDKFMVQFKNPE